MAQQILNNGESGLSFRTKLNDNFTELYPVASIAALRAAPYAGLISPAHRAVLGYYGALDIGGGGRFVWDPASTAADDGGLVINPTGNGGAGRWLRQVEDRYFDVRWWGAKSESNFDNGPALRAMIAAATRDQFTASTGPTGGKAFGGMATSRCHVPSGIWEVRSDEADGSCGLRIKKQVEFYGDGLETTVFHYYTAARKPFLLYKPQTAAEGGNGYAWGGHIHDFRVDGKLAEIGGVILTAEFPSAINAAVVERVQVRNTNMGVALLGSGVSPTANLSISSPPVAVGTTVYGCAVRECTVQGVVAGGAGFAGIGGTYNSWDNIEAIVNADAAGWSFYMLEPSSTYKLLRGEGAATFDCPAAKMDRYQVEYCFSNCAHNADMAVRINRFGEWDGLTLAGVGGLDGAPIGFGIFDSFVKVRGVRYEALATRVIGGKTYGANPQFPVAQAGTANVGCVIDSVSVAGAPPAFKLEAYWTADAFGTVQVFNAAAITDFSREPTEVTTLPTANALSRGLKRFLKGGAGVADRYVICRKDAADNYAWVDLF